MGRQKIFGIGSVWLAKVDKGPRLFKRAISEIQ